MKLISKDILIEYGFVENNNKTNNMGIVMTKNKLDVIVKTDGSFFYNENGIDYYLRDTAALRKVYKEINLEEFKYL
jgi:hypothetical protein